MKTSTRFTDLVGCSLPLQLAAMGGVGTAELAAAVVAAGGMGMVPRRVVPPTGACGVNFLVPFDPSLADVAEAAVTARAVEFFYGIPRADLVDAVHAGGAIAGWQVGSADEAAAAEASGCDYVVVQGTEAGGHVRGSQPLDDVLVAARAVVHVPLVAAGGVATARRVVEVMRLGADAVRVGTRFVTCPESSAHPEYIRRLLAATGDGTVLTEWYNQGWEGAPHRVLRSALEAAQRTGWRATTPPLRTINRDPDDMAMYAGTGVGNVKSAESAAMVVADLVRDLR
jgi:NAD(P)H-dependent flavin oxidoreductase YrpB (nitropropane dioxygenase family)